jgi:tRNA G18 (ribose-2'-O)-methylase SpoU
VRKYLLPGEFAVFYNFATTKDTKYALVFGNEVHGVTQAVYVMVVSKYRN